MSQYHKIQSIFKRDMQTGKFLIGQYSTPEIEYLSNNKWVWTEKVDGTNVRCLWDGSQVRFGGKTDNAQMPIPLFEALQKLFIAEKLELAFPPKEGELPLDDDNIVLYGEGYGPKIQSGGKYRKDHSCVLFDIRIGHWWLKQEDVNEIGNKLEVDVVPIVGEGTIPEAIEFVKAGFKSRWGDFQAEGLVLRPKVGLATRSGERIITKLKYKDFLKG